MARPQLDLIAEVRHLALDVQRIAAGSDVAGAVDAIVARLDEPLRLAIVGRVKAGKSTLLNALVGERLAPTDAGECTRIVTWYRHALGYEVSAVRRAGGRSALPFRREDGVLRIDAGDMPLESIERIDVGWPAQRLVDLTIIDTPGLGSIDDRSSERTSSALLDRGEGPGQADAVLYLMRHLHRSDAQFLEAFIERSIAHASPVNAVVVLSRADEIGAARPDALASARSIAERYAADPRVRDLASGVVPIAGLLAETGATLRQEQYDWLSAIARLDAQARDDLLLSVDRFRDPERSPLATDIREELLERFGLFGLRLAVGWMAAGAVSSATQLSRALIDASGIRELQRLLADRYGARADVLKARSALAALRAAVERLERDRVAGAAELVRAIDRLEAESGDLALLRLQHLVQSGRIELPADEESEVARLSVSGSPAERLGLPLDADAADVRDAAIAAIERWRAVAGNPLSDRPLVEASEIVSRAYEQIHAAIG
ncbi:MAG TPA: dynamin family protein [Candidatus Limnocylindrales bacterium]|jgi:hypothetical protein|nr:dynamin family protein [Candidatus Limnocylindrales bacterium]